MMEKKTLSFIDYNDIIDDQYTFYAHNIDNRKELLHNHIHLSQEYFMKLYDYKDIEKIVYKFYEVNGFQNYKVSFEFLNSLFVNIVTFHDFGKINPMFQKLKMNNNIGNKYKGLTKSHHSFLSSLIYLDYFLNKLDKMTNLSHEDRCFIERTILEHAYLISKHHSHLASFYEFIEKLKSSNTQNLIEHLTHKPLKGYKGLKYLTKEKIKSICDYLDYFQEKDCLTNHRHYKYFYYRLIYSMLVMSDYYATSEFQYKRPVRLSGNLTDIKEFEKEYYRSGLMQGIYEYEREKYHENDKTLSHVQTMNDLRCEIFLDADRNLKKHHTDPIFFLQAPTGSGKSNIALHLSFQLMKGRKKLFYIYPFNTLVEQNKHNLELSFDHKELMKQIVVVNSITPPPDLHDEEDEAYKYQQMLLDRQFLNYPFILSTHVSFFQLLFGNQKENIIGFHQLADSVIVLDEIQSYKNYIWAEMIEMLKACANLMNMKIIIMSATLPDLDHLLHLNDGVTRLLPNAKLYYQHEFFKGRVHYHYDLLKSEITLDDLQKHVLKNVFPHKKILVEFITKKSAYQFYRLLLKSGRNDIDIECLTGDDSAIERKRIISKIRGKVTKPIILVATQVIEAGVDIDMDIGYKNISLLDNEEQFAGRINRSNMESGDIYFFDIDNFHVIYRHDYRSDDLLTLKNQEMREILEEKDFSCYYEKVLKALKVNRNQNTDKEGLSYFYNDIVYKLNYLEVAKRMMLIDDNQWMVDVVLCRQIKNNDGEIIDGLEVWNRYKELLENNAMNYNKKQIELMDVRSQLHDFIYQFPKKTFIHYNDYIGDLLCVFDAEDYFVDGKLDRERFEQIEYDIL